MQLSVFFLLSALLSLAFAAPVNLKGAANIAIAAARFARAKPVRTQSLPPKLHPGAFVSARPVDVHGLHIINDEHGNPKKGAYMDHPGVITHHDPHDKIVGIAPISHTRIHPSINVKDVIDHPHLEGHIFVGGASIDRHNIRAATGMRAGGSATDSELKNLLARLPRDPHRPKPVRSQTLPLPKLEHHEEHHEPEEHHEEHHEEPDVSKTHRKGSKSG